MATNDLNRRGIAAPQLSHTLPVCEQPTKEYFTSNKLGGTWYMSEKFDGIRALWTGRELITRAWRSFTYVPPWFLKQMPIGTPLDGELFIPDVEFSYFSSLSVTKKCEAVDDKWKKVQYIVFDMPLKTLNFEQRLLGLQRTKFRGKQIKIMEFTKLHNIMKEFQKVNVKFKEVTKRGGEGVMLIKADSTYDSKRSRNSLKYKKEHTGEAIVVEVCEGLGRNSKRLGKLKCKLLESSRTFYCGTGFNDAERNFYHFDKTVCEFIDDDTDDIKVPRIGDIINYSCMEIIKKTGIPRMSVYRGIRNNNE